MNKSQGFWNLVLIVGIVSLAGMALSQENPAQVDGWVGLDSPTGHGYLAIKLDFPEDMALSGILWYNNDENIVFPKVLVATGFELDPGDLSNSMEVHGAISGASVGLSEVVFSQPIAASLGGLYVVFEFPEGSQFTALGQGGGAAFGCFQGEEVVRGWISGDGENWIMLDAQQHFAVEPVLVAREEGMAVKSLEDGGGDPIEEQGEVRVAFLNYGPNPFNSTIKFQFGIPEGGRVEVDVFDLRGARVKTLVDQEMPMGRHSVFWNGDDHSGRKVSSGVYLVRMKASGIAITKRVLLVK